MNSEIMETKKKDMAYEDARKKLKEVETLLTHRKPLEVDQIDGLDTKMGLYSVISGMVGVFGAPIGIVTTIQFSEPLLLLFILPALAWIPFLGINYDGNPKKKIRKFLYNLTVPKKQKVIQEKQFEIIREHNLQEKIFKLFVEQKKQELTNLGVFDVLNQGSPDSYPRMNEYGEVIELSPHQWRTLQSRNVNENKESLEDKLNMEANLRYLLKENSHELKGIEG